MRSKKYPGAVIFAVICVCIFVLIPKSPVIFVSQDGDDANPGTRQSPVKTIQHGVTLAANGGTLRIAPGEYRESIHITGNPSAKKISLIPDRSKNGTVKILGSDLAVRLQWNNCETMGCIEIPFSLRKKIYVADIASDEIPSAVFERTSEGTFTPLPLAKSPNGQPSKEKYHDSWFGNGQSGGTPTRLIDPQLATLPDIAGADAFIMDGGSRCGTFLHIRSVIQNDPRTQSLFLDMPVGATTYGIQESGIGKHIKYYVEDAITLLDEPGEWYADHIHGKIYIWPKQEKNPALLPIEIGSRKSGITISRSQVEITDLHLLNFNGRYSDLPGGAIVIHPSASLDSIRLNGLFITNTPYGIYAEPENGASIRGIQIHGGVFSKISRSPIFMSGKSDGSGNVSRIDIDGVRITESGYPFNEPAIFLTRVFDARIRNTDISDTASYGIHVTGQEKHERITRAIRIENNRINKSCQNASACAGIKIFGGAFEKTVIANNTVYDIPGWSYCYEMEEKSSGYGIGIFISNASGITVRNNVSQHTTGPAYLAFTRQLPATHNRFYKNIAANSQVGIALDGSGDEDMDKAADASRHDQTVIFQNILRKNDVGMRLDPGQRNFITVRGNLFDRNGRVGFLQGIEITDPKNLQDIPK